MKFLQILLLTLCLCSAHSIEITQQETGRTLEANIISADEKNVQFTIKGKEYSLPLSSLTQESRVRITAYLSSDSSANTVIFGNPIRAQKIIFIVDASASMNGSRNDLTRNAL